MNFTPHTPRKEPVNRFPSETRSPSRALMIHAPRGTQIHCATHTAVNRIRKAAWFVGCDIVSFRHPEGMGWIVTKIGDPISPGTRKTQYIFDTIASGKMIPYPDTFLLQNPNQMVNKYMPQSQLYQPGEREALMYDPMAEPSRHKHTSQETPENTINSAAPAQPEPTNQETPENTEK